MVNERRAKRKEQRGKSKEERAKMKEQRGKSKDEREQFPVFTFRFPRQLLNQLTRQLVYLSTCQLINQ